MSRLLLAVTSTSGHQQSSCKGRGHVDSPGLCACAAYHGGQTWWCISSGRVAGHSKFPKAVALTSVLRAGPERSMGTCILWTS